MAVPDWISDGWHRKWWDENHEGYSPTEDIWKTLKQKGVRSRILFTVTLGRSWEAVNGKLKVPQGRMEEALRKG